MKVKNWTRFQHFKDRKPPWIKLYREVLEQRDISLISDCSFRVLIGCWLLASEDEAQEGNLPCVEDIAFRLRIDKSKVIKALRELSPWLYQDDIKTISTGYQIDAPETETETEERQRHIIARPGRSGDMTEEFLTFYKAYPKHEDKRDAWKAWQSLNGKRPPLEALLAAIDTQRRGRKWQEGFIKSPASWLRKGSWEDEPEVPARIAQEIRKPIVITEEEQREIKKWVG